ncbi:hydroxypyruvate isomerase [Thermocatellispora tengchongensis]|uniref:Hydroxypyruvate isomerase n=1 Tax=Thermocatellispora tengchongensis TaxID=1073253 RepID=A0A840PI27_9ACTN|nr:TIM barrel protein [Thermocatellispora tengchongensis]MBB5138486.1 hydroxypyruvate isomerase [Thermocatellispora tengchongensis]
MKLSASVELLFREAGPDHGERIRAAADAGIDTVEIWQHSDKDLASIEKALNDTGSRLWTLLIEGRATLADAKTHESFLDNVRAAAVVARRLGCDRIVTGSGVGLPYMRRAVQHRTVVDALKAGADIAAEHGVVIVLENLNTKVDHPGTLFDTTAECLQAIREVGSPGLALLYDMYHSLQMGETPEREVAEAIDLVSHVQIADLPERTEPGTGEIDWEARLRSLRDLGYTGPVGLEYVPTTASLASLAHIQQIAAAL